MKNTLLTTTAIALTGFAGAANAVDIAAGAVNLEITGFFRTTVAASNTKIGAGSDNANADYDGVDILTNSEIHFKPSITLDNGIKIGADIELEGNTSSDQIDESTIFAIGGFGKVEFGSKDSAGKLMQVFAPDVSMVSANSTSLGSFVPFSGPSTVPDFASDAERLTYFTPDFGGFKVGVSYARNNSQTSRAVNNNASGIGTDYADIGITYGGTVGEVGISFSARYGTYDLGFDGVAHLKALTSVYPAAIAASTAAARSEAASKSLLTTAAAALVTATATAAAAATAVNTAANALDAGTLKTAAVSAAATLVADTAAAAAAATAANTAANARSEADSKLLLTTAANTAFTESTAAATLVIDAAAAGRPTVVGVGLSLGFGDFAIGGGYVEVDEDIVGLSNAKTYDIGVSYANGPMGYSLTYVRGETAGNTKENTSLVAAATYKVNANFKVGASLASVETDVAGGTKGDIEGQVLALSAHFNF